MKKTNAARLLDTLGITYEVRTYAVDEADLGAATVAAGVGLPLEQVFKTLLAIGDRTGPLLVVVPGDSTLDLHALAPQTGNRRVEMAPLREVQGITGYVRGGVSPLATRRPLPVYVDEMALLHDRISISAGLRGVQLLLAPADLVRAAKAKVVRL